MTREEEIASLGEENSQQMYNCDSHLYTNLKTISEELKIVLDIDEYRRWFNHPEAERRVRIVPQDIFTPSFTLVISNEIIEEGSGSLQSLGMPKWIVEISLLTLEGGIIYKKQDTQDQALAVTANPEFFAVYMKSGVIRIFSTKVGNLIAPYSQQGNLVFLSSYTNGNLAFLDLLGKISVINVYEKKVLFEDDTWVKKLLSQLTSKSFMSQKNTQWEEEYSLAFYVSLFYIQEDNIFIQVTHKENNIEVYTYSLNFTMKNWEKIDHISQSILEDEKAGNIGVVGSTDDMEEDGMIQKPGLQISQQKSEKAYFKLEKNKQKLIDSIGVSIDEMENHINPAPTDLNSLECLEENIMLYERLEHKEEYFITLETYLIKCVMEGEVERIAAIVSKYDSQYGVQKNLKLSNSGIDEYFLGLKTSSILENFIKPKVRLNQALYKKIFGKS